MIYKALRESNNNIIEREEIYLQEAEGDGIWAKIKNFFINIINAIKNFFAKLFGKGKAQTENGLKWIKANEEKIKSGFVALNGANAKLYFQKDSCDFALIWQKVNDIFNIIIEVNQNVDISEFLEDLKLLDPSDVTEDVINSGKTYLEQQKKEFEEKNNQTANIKNKFVFDKEEEKNLIDPNLLETYLQSKAKCDEQVAKLKQDIESQFNRTLKELDQAAAKSTVDSGLIKQALSLAQQFATLYQNFVLGNINRVYGQISKAESEIMKIAKHYASYSGKKPEDIKDEEKKIIIGTTFTNEAYIDIGGYGIFSETVFI